LFVSLRYRHLTVFFFFAPIGRRLLFTPITKHHRRHDTNNITNHQHHQHHQSTIPTNHQKAADERLTSDVLGIAKLEERRQRWRAVASLTETVEGLVALELQVGVAAAQGNFSKAIDLAVDVQVDVEEERVMA